MSDQQQNPEPDDDEVGEPFNVAVTLYPTDGSEVSLRTVALGVVPVVLIEVSDDDETGVRVDVTGSLVDDYEDLLGKLQMALAVVEAVVAQGAAESDEDEEADRG